MNGCEQQADACHEHSGDRQLQPAYVETISFHNLSKSSGLTKGNQSDI